MPTGKMIDSNLWDAYTPEQMEAWCRLVIQHPAWSHSHPPLNVPKETSMPRVRGTHRNEKWGRPPRKVAWSQSRYCGGQDLAV